MRRFILKLETQFSNVGDILINKVLIDHLLHRGEVIVDKRRIPPEFIPELMSNEVKCLSIVDPEVGSIDEYIDRIAAQKSGPHQNYLVLVPGDLKRKGIRAAAIRAWQYRRLSRLKRSGIRIMRLGFSLNRLLHGHSWVEALHTRAYHAYGLRDSISQGTATRFRFSNVVSFPDWAWAFKWLDDGHVSKDEGYIVMSFRANAYGKTYDPKYLQVIGEKLLSGIRESGFANRKFIIYSQVESDIIASRQLAKILSHGCQVTLIDHVIDRERVLKLHSCAHAVISNRLHVLLLAIASPTLAIPFVDEEDNAKILGLFRDNGLASTIIPQGWSAVDVADRMDYLSRHRLEYLHQYELRRSENQKTIEYTLDKICA